MNLSDEEQRKMLNKAWDVAFDRGCEEGIKRNYYGRSTYVYSDARHRDVSKIIKKAGKQRKDGRDG